MDGSQISFEMDEATERFELVCSSGKMDFVERMDTTETPPAFEQS
jgi:hypothetical protein